ncbi:c-type cytochrome [Candidatus Methylobacter oryzae]|uniref:Cytochrome c n=1 Tax=Candidatus Methylobacter oryzae TaxID=2497749 RepID=A0ABY3C7L0_9GAMM|nr:cytochrome c [Candidatus Methylobacter oryzae]TRW92057.1 cytochrome c [Candidatus Methylobacter oryzae]
MNTKSTLVILSLFFTAGNAFATDPFYEGANGIREQIFVPHCLGCHSSNLAGSARNGAPDSFNWDTYEATLQNAARAVARATDPMPSFNDGIPVLNQEQSAAMLAWQRNGYPRAATTSGIANYSYDNNMLTLPVVNVGSQTYNATLRLNTINSSPTGIGFVLETAQPTTDSSGNAANFFPTTGQMTIPVVQLMQNGASQNQVSAELTLVPNSNPFLFILNSYNTVPGAQ